MTTISSCTAKLGVGVALAVSACAPPREPSDTPLVPIGSRFAAAPTQQWRLPDRLHEISGLAVAPDGRLFGHDDEAAWIYEIDVAAGRIIKAFAVGAPIATGDFEGLAIAPDGRFWLTTSRGRLYSFRETSNGAAARFDSFDTSLDDICEIEGLAYSAAEESLILACKQNIAHDMRATISLYAWRPGGDGEPYAWRTWQERALAEAAGVDRFQPSSLDIDAEGRMILVSARDGALAEFTAEGTLASARALGGGHPQAEGVAVLAGGDLVVADEGGSGRALLSIYPGLP